MVIYKILEHLSTVNNHFPSVYRNIQSAPKHIFDITHHFEDASKLLFVFIDRKLFFIAQIRRRMIGRRKGREWGLCQAVEAVPEKPNPSFLVCMLASPATSHPTLLFSFKGEKHRQSLKRGKLEQGCMWTGERGGETSVIPHSYIRRGCFGGAPWPWKARMRHNSPLPFRLPERGCAGEWASTSGSSLSQLGGLGEIMTHGGGRIRKGGAGWITLLWRSRALCPQLWGLTQGLVELLSMKMGKRSAGWPAEDGSLPGRAEGWGRNRGNWEDGGGRGATQMPTCSLLHGRREGQALLVPTSSPRQCLQGICSAGFNHPELQQRATSFLEGHGDTHLLLHELVLVEEARRGTGQFPRVHREEATEPKMRTSASQRGLPSWESIMTNTTDLLVLTSWIHSKPLSSPGTNHCCALFSREKRDFI